MTTEKTTKKVTKKPVKKAKKQNTKPDFFKDFLKIQNGLSPIKKDEKGVYDNKYATLNGLWEVLEPLASSNNFIIYHKTSKKNVGVLTTAEHITGRKLTSYIAFSGEPTPQKKGGEITYYRRYNLLQIFNIMTEDDDTQEVTNTIKQNPQAQFPTNQPAPAPTDPKIPTRDEIKVVKDINTLEQMWKQFSQIADINWKNAVMAKKTQLLDEQAKQEEVK